MKPGAIALTRTPIGPSSFDIVCVTASIPALAAEYADWPEMPFAETELKLIMQPWPHRTMRLAIAEANRKGAVKLAVRTAFHETTSCV